MVRMVPEGRNPQAKSVTSAERSSSAAPASRFLTTRSQSSSIASSPRRKGFHTHVAAAGARALGFPPSPLRPDPARRLPAPSVKT